MRAGAVLLFTLLTLTAGGCKVKERTAAAVVSDVRVEAGSRRDSVRVVTRDRVILRTDTVTVREVVREYGAPVLVRDTVFFTPLVRETTRETESGARSAWREKADSLLLAHSDGTFGRSGVVTTDTRTDRTTDDKSGAYLTIIVLGALALLLYFIGKRIDKWKLLE